MLCPSLSQTHKQLDCLTHRANSKRSCVRVRGVPIFALFFVLHTHCHSGQILVGRCRILQSGPIVFFYQSCILLFVYCIAYLQNFHCLKLFIAKYPCIQKKTCHICIFLRFSCSLNSMQLSAMFKMFKLLFVINLL